jgi:NNP family nitrate/nitrite transporter-like MFS transporter
MKDQPASFRASLGLVLSLASIFMINFMARIILGPLMPAVEVDLGLTHGEAGSFFFFITSGYFITVLGSGYFSSRWNHRRTIIASAWSLGITLLAVPLCRNLWILRADLFLLGLCSGLYLASGMVTLTTCTDARHWGKAFAIHDLGPNLAFIGAPLVSEALLGYWPWQSAPVLLGAASLLLGLGFALFRKGGEFPGEALSPGSALALFRNPTFWTLMGLFAIGITATMGVYAMLPLYLVAGIGMERDWANTLTSLSRISGLWMAFVGGWARDRYGAPRTMFSVLLFLGTCTVALGTSSGTWLAVLIFVQGAVAACFFPAGLAALSSLAKPESRNVAISLTIPLAFMFGGGLIPSLIGVLGDAGAFRLSMILVGALTSAGSFLSLTLKSGKGK